MDKRGSERKAARLKVRFWRAGVPDRVYTGYTANISLGGCFVQTDQPVGTAGRIQMELTADEHGFVCEGVVARSIKAPYELRQVKPSGMGIRFLTIEELLRAVVPSALDESKSANEALRQSEFESGAVDTGTPTGSTHESASSSENRAKDPDQAAEASRRAARSHPAAPPRQPGSSTGQPGATPRVPKPVPDLAFRLAPPSMERLAAMYHAELMQDQLFIPTTKAASAGATVRVELVLPQSGTPPAAQSVELFGSVQSLWRKDSPGNAPGQPAGREGLSLRLLPAESAKKTIGALVASLD